MTKNIIFGKNSKLTSSIVKNLNNVQVFSANDLYLKNLNTNDKTKVNYIFNNFYPSFKLNNLKPNDYKEFVDLSLVKLVEILSNLQSKNINKIIETPLSV